MTDIIGLGQCLSFCLVSQRAEGDIEVTELEHDNKRHDVVESSIEHIEHSDGEVDAEQEFDCPVPGTHS